MNRLMRWIVTGVIVCGFAAALIPGTARAQDGAPSDQYTLVPFVDVAQGFSTLVPEDWLSLQEGVFGPPGTPDTPGGGLASSTTTLLVQQAHRGAERSALRTAIRQQMALDRLPEPEPVAGVLAWDVYTFERGDMVADFAISERGAVPGAPNMGYIVAIRAQPDDYADFHDSVLLPVLAAFTPFPYTESAEPVQEPETWPTGGWQIAPPEEHGIDGALLDAMIPFVEDNALQVNSISVIRHGALVFDYYFPSRQPDQRHQLFSVTKSFTSTLVGIAIDQGLIAGVTVPVLSLFPDRTVANVDADKEAMTLEHLLTMTAGFECDDEQFGTIGQMSRSPDAVQFMLDLPMSEAPGTRFNYCNGVSHLLAAIVQDASGMSVIDFANATLFGPLGITDVTWTQDKQGINLGYSDLKLTPHDMAKLGYLYLHNGMWDGQRIVSAKWVDTATSNHSPMRDISYGYQWWARPQSGMYAALGYAGQQVIVVPALDLVVVFTSAILPEADLPLNWLLGRYILPAVE